MGTGFICRTCYVVSVLSTISTLYTRRCCRMRGAQVPGVGLAALCAAAAHMRGAARLLSEGAAAGLDDAGFFISLLHACLAHLPSWLQGAAGNIEAAAKEALSQVRRWSRKDNAHRAALTCS